MKIAKWIGRLFLRRVSAEVRVSGAFGEELFERQRTFKIAGSVPRFVGIESVRNWILETARKRRDVQRFLSGAYHHRIEVLECWRESD